MLSPVLCRSQVFMLSRQDASHRVIYPQKDHLIPMTLRSNSHQWTPARGGDLKGGFATCPFVDLDREGRLQKDGGAAWLKSCQASSMALMPASMRIQTAALAECTRMRGGTKPRRRTASSIQRITSYPVPRASSPRSWSRLISAT